MSLSSLPSLRQNLPKLGWKFDEVLQKQFCAIFVGHDALLLQHLHWCITPEAPHKPKPHYAFTSVRPSVCLSVCLSVLRSAVTQNEKHW